MALLYDLVSVPDNITYLIEFIIVMRLLHNGLITEPLKNIAYYLEHY